MEIFVLKCFLIIFTILGFFMFRNSYTYSCVRESDNIIYKYIQYLVDNNKYNANANYYRKMEIDYDKHLFSIWLWRKYSAIKPEYRKLLKSFEE